MAPPGGDRPRPPPPPPLGATASHGLRRPSLAPRMAAKASSTTMAAPLVVKRPLLPPRRDDAPWASSSAAHAIPAAPLPGSGLDDALRIGPRHRDGVSPATPANYDAWHARASRSNMNGPRRRLADESPTDSPKFFYASDVKTRPRPASVPQKPVAFLYANGASADSQPSFRPSATQDAAPTTREVRFLSTHGALDMAAANGTLAAPVPATPAAAPKIGPVRPAAAASTLGVQRPASPLKAAPPGPGPAPLLSPRKSLPVLSPSPAMAPAPATALRGKVSMEAAPRLGGIGHARSGSASTAELSTASSTPPLSPVPPQVGMTMARLVEVAGELSEREVDRSTDGHSGLTSPAKSSSFATGPVSALVANARRERKVQDLEITNASLEAINRTLERQLRKQTTELRRYRRLSWSGRVSLVAPQPSSRTPSAALTDPAIELSALSEDAPATSDAEEDGDDDDDDDDDDDGYDDSLDSLDSLDTSGLCNTTSAAAVDEKLAVRRRHDERRLHLDLTKHQELLMDSQKMNQSIKRCLDWTDVLIREGQKALAYHVRVYDVAFGGRMLAPLDEEDDDGGDDDGAHGLRPPCWAKGPQDRDSGIELPVDGG